MPRFWEGCGGSSLPVRRPAFSGKTAAAVDARLYREEEAFRGGSSPTIALKAGGRGHRFFADYTEHRESVPRHIQQRFEAILTLSTERIYVRSRNAFIWCEQFDLRYPTVTDFAKYRSTSTFQSLPRCS
jgi:hypothetical protein